MAIFFIICQYDIIYPSRLFTCKASFSTFRNVMSLVVVNSPTLLFCLSLCRAAHTHTEGSAPPALREKQGDGDYKWQHNSTHCLYLCYLPKIYMSSFHFSSVWESEMMYVCITEEEVRSDHKWSLETHVYVRCGQGRRQLLYDCEFCWDDFNDRMSASVIGFSVQRLLLCIHQYCFWFPFVSFLNDIIGTLLRDFYLFSITVSKNTQYWLIHFYE